MNVRKRLAQQDTGPFIPQLSGVDYTKGLLLLAVTEEAVRLQCEIDALYWNLVQQGKTKMAVTALRRGQLQHQEDKARIYGKP